MNNETAQKIMNEINLQALRILNSETQHGTLTAMQSTGLYHLISSAAGKVLEQHVGSADQNPLDVFDGEGNETENADRE